MSFGIIEKLGGEKKAIAILKAADVGASSDSIRMWAKRGMSARAQLAFMDEAKRRKIKFGGADFKNQPEEPKNG